MMSTYVCPFARQTGICSDLVQGELLAWQSLWVQGRRDWCTSYVTLSVSQRGMHTSVDARIVQMQARCEVCCTALQILRLP